MLEIQIIWLFKLSIYYYFFFYLQANLKFQFSQPQTGVATYPLWGTLCVSVYGTLSCFSVGVYNAAIRKSADLSEIEPKYPYGANLGVDNIMNPDLFGGSCFHTAYTQKNYWQVDLAGPTLVTDFIITNRADCCGKDN